MTDRKLYDSIALLEELKRHFTDEKGRPASDYRVAKILGCTKSAVSHVRTGKQLWGDEACLQIAEILHLDPQFVLGCVYTERAGRTQNDRVVDAWKKIARGAAVVTTAALFVGFSGMSAPPAQAAFSGDRNIHYAQYGSGWQRSDIAL